MERQGVQAVFDQKCAAGYDQQWARLAPLRDALHLLAGEVLSGLRPDARVLCVGVGTGAELFALAQRFPGWRFTAVEPSAPMLDVCRRKAEENGVAARCEFHAGYLESLPPTEPFDAATSLLVSQFITERDARSAFFREIAGRLRPGGYLISSDLAADTTSAAYHTLLEVWVRVMRGTEATAEDVERVRTTYSRDVAVLPPAEVAELIAAAGFDPPVLFLQTGLIHAWLTRRLDK